MLRRTVLFAARKPNPAGACAAVVKDLQRPSTKHLLSLEKAHSANNYSPLPAVFAKARGVVVTDPEGRSYFDFLSGYGAVSQGHLHPRIQRAAMRQLRLCTLSSRAFHSALFGAYAAFITKFFGYDRVLPMNTGAEGVETALKLARRWAYVKKGVPNNRALVVCCRDNFHGRTFGAISMSTDPDSFGLYGPLLPGFIKVPYGDTAALERVFAAHGKRIAAFIGEPVQGEAGVIIPPPGFFAAARRLCDKHNALLIADEVQSGIARTGKLLAIEHERVRPDVVILAKALGGGVLPVAAVLADTPIMEVFQPGTHGSTFGGNPLACAVAIEALRVVHEERLAERSAELGEVLLAELQKLQAEFPVIEAVRGRGLFAAIDFKRKALGGEAAYKCMHLLKNHGVLAKTTHGHTLRLSPPLVITKKQLLECVRRLRAALVDLSKLL